MELDKDQIDGFYQIGTYNSWNGFRQIGLDGSTARLPASKEIQAKYGLNDTSETGTALNQARVVPILWPVELPDNGRFIIHIR